MNTRKQYEGPPKRVPLWHCRAAVSAQCFIMLARYGD